MSIFELPLHQLATFRLVLLLKPLKIRIYLLHFCLHLTHNMLQAQHWLTVLHELYAAVLRIDHSERSSKFCGGIGKSVSTTPERGNPDSYRNQSIKSHSACFTCLRAYNCLPALL